MDTTRRRMLDDDIYQAEVEEYRAGKTYEQILAALQERFPGKAPTTERTVRRHLANVPGGDRSGPWLIADADGDEVRTVLDFMREWLESTDYQGLRTLTRSQGRWLARLTKAAPGLDRYMLFQLAHEYATRGDLGIRTDDLDAYLMFMPWQSDDRRASYQAALNAGAIRVGVQAAPGMVITADYFHRLEQALAAPLQKLTIGGEVFWEEHKEGEEPNNG